MSHDPHWKHHAIQEKDCDLHGFIVDTIGLNASDTSNETRIGYCFDMVMEPMRMEISCYDKTQAEIEIKYAGVYLFSSGIGFFYYQLKVVSEVTDRELITIQFSLKETANLNYESAKGFERGYTLIRGGDEVFHLGTWINACLDEIGVETCYFAHRKYKSVVYPDHALVFTGAVIDGDEEEIVRDAFLLANGMGNGSVLPSDLAGDMFIPYQSQYWLVGDAGCGYFLKYNKDNEHFQKSILPRRLLYNYFPAYVLSLHQSYGLLRHVELIESQLHGDPAMYLQPDRELAMKLNKHQILINAFLLKSGYGSISSSDSINRFYTYASQRLRIPEHISSLKTSLDALAELEKREYEEKVNASNENTANALGVLSFLTIISALLDGTNLVKMVLQDSGEPVPMAHILLYVAMYVLIYQKPQKSGTDFYKASAYNSRQTMQNSSLLCI